VVTGEPLPTRPDGFLDINALQHQLSNHPNSRQRPALVRDIIGVLTAHRKRVRDFSVRGWTDVANRYRRSRATSPAAQPCSSPAGAMPRQPDPPRRGCRSGPLRPDTGATQLIPASEKRSRKWMYVALPLWLCWRYLVSPSP